MERVIIWTRGFEVFKESRSVTWNAFSRQDDNPHVPRLVSSSSLWIDDCSEKLLLVVSDPDELVGWLCNESASDGKLGHG